MAIEPTASKAVTVFREASKPCQDLIRAVLREERDVQHLKKKTEIHVKIFEHIRRLIK